MGSRRVIAAGIVFALLGATAPVAQQAETLRTSGATPQFRSVGSGPPIIIVAGGAGTAANYMWPVASELAASGYRCIVYDQRGRGGSIADAVDADHINLAASVADLEALRTHLALDRVTLLGHSWGAMLAAAYVASHPERVERLVLVGPGPLFWDLPFLEAYDKRLTARAPGKPAVPASGTPSAKEAREENRRLAGGMIANPASWAERHKFFLYTSSHPANEAEWDLMLQNLEKTKFDTRAPLREWPGRAIVIHSNQTLLAARRRWIASFRRARGHGASSRTASTKPSTSPPRERSCGRHPSSERRGCGNANSERAADSESTSRICQP